MPIVLHAGELHLFSESGLPVAFLLDRLDDDARVCWSKFAVSWSFDCSIDSFCEPLLSAKWLWRILNKHTIRPRQMDHLLLAGRAQGRVIAVGVGPSDLR
jgi:hypothetical protein